MFQSGLDARLPGRLAVGAVRGDESRPLHHLDTRANDHVGWPAHNLLHGRTLAQRHAGLKRAVQEVGVEPGPLREEHELFRGVVGEGLRLADGKLQTGYHPLGHRGQIERQELCSSYRHGASAWLVSWKLGLVQ